MNKLTIFLALYFIPIFVMACIVPQSAERRMDDRDLVFTGIVKEISCVNNDTLVNFLPKEVWKQNGGDVTYSIYIKGCPKKPYLNKLEKYLIFAKLDANYNYYSNEPNHCCDCTSDIQEEEKPFLHWLWRQYYRMRHGVDYNMGYLVDVKSLGKLKYQVDEVKHLNELIFQQRIAISFVILFIVYLILRLIKYKRLND